MYLVTAASFENRQTAFEHLNSQQIPDDLIDNELFDRDGSLHPDFQEVLAQHLLPEEFGEPPSIEPIRLGRTLDDLVELKYLAAETAHNIFSLIAPHTQIEIFVWDKDSHSFIIPEPTHVDTPEHVPAALFEV